MAWRDSGGSSHKSLIYEPKQRMDKGCAWPLHVTLTFLDKRDTLHSNASLLSVQRHARQTYDEVTRLLPVLAISDVDRRRIEERVKDLRLRLVELEKNSSPEAYGLPPC
jgi:hypothetical protein